MGLALVLAVVGAVALAPPARAVATRTVAFYSMDETAGQTVLRDSSGNGRNGTIGADVTLGAVYQGATGHRYATHLPSDGAFPGHVDRVPHTSDFNPEAGDFSIEIRLRTTYQFGNIVQKGQGSNPGGYWKLENPEGLPRCLFRGAEGSSRTGYAVTPINDGQWHTIRCNRTSSYVEMLIDGVRQSRLNGTTGTISNTTALSIGGKGNCDGTTVTCDYFVGDVDYLRIEKGSGGAANVPPTPVLATSCSGLTCGFSGAASTDPDGAIQSYAWAFGDGATAATGSTATTTHSYSAAGTYTVTLTVTDDRGATASASRSVTVAPIPEKISFIGQSTSNVNSTTHQVVVPAGVQPGDALVLFFSQNTTATRTGPTGVTGWTQLDSVAQGYGRTTAWSKVAQAGDAGATVRLALSSATKGNFVLAAYRGTDATAPVQAFAGRTDPVSSASRTSPFVTVATAQSWGVSYWMHGDALSTALTPPAGVVVRSNSSQTGGGRVTGLLADSGASLPPGPYGGLVATGSAAGTTGTSWTVILQPASGTTPPHNQAPTASFTADCTGLACTFDASASSDPDGTVTGWAWEFGDGEQATTTEPAAARTYAAAGSYTVRLTVTDNGGLTGTTTRTVPVTAPPEPSALAFVAANNASRTSATQSVTVPAAVQAGDTLLLFLGIASNETVSNPSGWQALASVDGGSLRTRVWWRTATAADAGSTVSVALGASVKGNLAVAGYRGALAAAPVFAGAAASGSSATRTTPSAPVAVSGSWAVSYWAHRDGSTTALVAPAGIESRTAGSQSGGGRVTVLLADSGATVATGSYGGLSATAAAASAYGVAWTVVLAPAG
jgi:PKD repeat protein